MIDNLDELYNDMEAVRQIPIVSTMLDVICRTTGMGFAAIARVTNDRWLACSVKDDLQFGLTEGEELEIKTTICNEIRDHLKPVIIDNVAEDLSYCNHHTPKIYGLKSYVSFPIILKNGAFFGTLCAIDTKPHKINDPKIIGMFTMFTDLLSFHLHSADLLERSLKANRSLSNKNNNLINVNKELDNFVYTASHDLKSPISNIEGLLNALQDSISMDKLDRIEISKIIDLMKISVERFLVTIKDLTTIVESDNSAEVESFEPINIKDLVDNVKQDINDLIVNSNAHIKVECEEDVRVNYSKKNLKSILYNLLNNAIKYRSLDRIPEVIVKVEKIDEKINLSVKDNGLGIPSDKKDKVFSMFNRFHDHVEGTGIGLYIVKRMIDNSNGNIEVKSKVGEGTTFTIVF